MIPSLPKMALTDGEQPDKPVIAHEENFETLKRAFENDHLGLLEVELVLTGERVAAICAFAPDGKGGFAITPFAVMPNGSPYKLLNPPKPGGGFITQLEAWAEGNQNQ